MQTVFSNEAHLTETQSKALDDLGAELLAGSGFEAEPETVDQGFVDHG